VSNADPNLPAPCIHPLTPTIYLPFSRRKCWSHRYVQIRSPCFSHESAHVHLHSAFRDEQGTSRSRSRPCRPHHRLHHQGPSPHKGKAKMNHRSDADTLLSFIILDRHDASTHPRGDQEAALQDPSLTWLPQSAVHRSVCWFVLA
jgi:hypothetical protein